MAAVQRSSEFLDYLATKPNNGLSAERLPALNDLAKELGVSVSSLREQMEVARALGLVEARPRTGVRRLPYTFTPAVRQSLSYALALDPHYFSEFADLRRSIEAAYWRQAVVLLTAEDCAGLQELVERAWEKLNGSPVQIPQAEHRALHLNIFRRLENPFVQGILEAYWDAYEAVGLNVYADLRYLQEVWTYHQRMVEAIVTGELEAGYQALLEHTDLIHQRPRQASIPVDERVKHQE